MVDQFSIEREQPQETRAITELGGNVAGFSRKRKISLSGPNSEGEKSLIQKEPIYLISPKTKIPVFNSCLCSLDEVVATPALNVSVIEGALDKDFKLFDSINNSKYTAFIDSAFASLSLFAISIGIYSIQYCKLREIERHSNYFYFSRLFKSFNEEKIKNKMGEIKQDIHYIDDPITYEYLQTAAYFYPPDISPIACWRRRFFASKKEKQQLNSLDIFLKNLKQKKIDRLLKEFKKKLEKIDKDTENLYAQNINAYLQVIKYFYSSDISKIIYWKRRLFASEKKKKLRKILALFLDSGLDELHQKITEQVCNLLNHEAEFKFFKTKKNANYNWIIGLDKKYKEKFFNYVEHLIKDNSDSKIKENSKKKNNTCPSLLSALAKTSFIYWILVFLFYFIPSAPVITSALISVIPLSLSVCIFFPLFFFIKRRKERKIYKDAKEMKKEIIEDQHKTMLESKLLFLNKQDVYIKFTQNKEINSTIQLKNSSLLKDLHTVIKKRRFSKYHALCMAFLEGCFLVLFVSWVLLDVLKVILTYAFCPSDIALTSYTPISFLVLAIITGAILIGGISYGIYLAYKAKKAHDVRFNDLEDKINVLEKERGDKIILEKDYDRILRRFSSTRPLWTDLKKGINRFMAIIKRLGTGSLVFRLVLWTPIMAIYAAVVASSAVPTFFPIVLIIGTAIGGFALASWYLYAYHIESKTTQAQRIIEYFIQSEQLIDINKAVTFSLLESLATQNLITDVSESSKNSAKSENDMKFMSQQNVQENDLSKDENVHSETFNEVTTQAKTDRPRSSSHSRSQGLFKMNELTNKENLDNTCLSPVMSS